MLVRNKFLFVFVFILLLDTILKAQTPKERTTVAGIQASFVSTEMLLRANRSVISNQRRTYLQAFVLRPATNKQQWGLHIGYLESSIDQQVIPGFSTSFLLERTTALDLGFIHRFNRTLWTDKLFLFFQSTLDFEFANERRITSTQRSKEQGLGGRFQLRPGISYKISKDASLEFGFGLLNLNTMQHFDPTISGGSRTSRQTNLDVSFGVTSLFLGFTFKL